MARLHDMRGLGASPAMLSVPIASRVVTTAAPSGSVAVRSPGGAAAPLQAGSARRVDLIEADLRALNDRGKAVYNNGCVWGGPGLGSSAQAASGHWIYDPAFPLGAGNTLASLNISAGLALHRSQPPWTGLAPQFNPANRPSFGQGQNMDGRANDPYAFVGLKYDDVPPESVTSLFLFDVYEECRLALAWLVANAHTVAVTGPQRAAFCAEVGRYGACLYDAACRPTPSFYISIQDPYWKPVDTTLAVQVGAVLARADDMEAALGRPLRDEDLLGGGAALPLFDAIAAHSGDPWSWNDIGPATSTVPSTTTTTTSVEGTHVHHVVPGFAYGGSTVLTLQRNADGTLRRVPVVSGADFANRALALAAYLAPHDMLQFLLAEWGGYLTAIKPFVDAGTMGMTSDQLVALQTDAAHKKSIADAQTGLGVAAAGAAVIPAVGQLAGIAIGAVSALLGFLPTASGVSPQCPPPFLMRYPSHMPDGGVADIVASAGAESTRHDVAPPSFSFVDRFVVAKKSAASSALVKKIAIGAGVAAVLGGLWWAFKRSKS